LLDYQKTGLFDRRGRAWREENGEQVARISSLGRLWPGATLLLRSKWCLGKSVRLQNPVIGLLLALAENVTIIPVNFQRAISFTIWCSFRTDRLCADLDTSLEGPCDNHEEWGCWGPSLFVVEMDDRGDLAVVLSHPSRKEGVLSMLGSPVTPLGVQFVARAAFQNDSILMGLSKSSKVFKREFGKCHGLDAMKQDKYSLPIHFSLFGIFPRMRRAFGRRLAGAHSSGIARLLFEVLGGEFVAHQPAWLPLYLDDGSCAISPTFHVNGVMGF
jgi:hypothetical protein